MTTIKETTTTTSTTSTMIFDLAKVSKTYRKVAGELNKGKGLLQTEDGWVLYPDKTKVSEKTIKHLQKVDEQVFNVCIVTPASPEDEVDDKRAMEAKATKTAKEEVKKERPIGKEARVAIFAREAMDLEVFSLNQLWEAMTKVKGNEDITKATVRTAISFATVNKKRPWRKDGECDDSRLNDSFYRVERGYYAVYDADRDGKWIIENKAPVCTEPGTGFDIPAEITDSEVENLK